MPSDHVSDSTAQREAEAAALLALGGILRVAVRPVCLELAPGTRIELDGFVDGAPAIAAEVFVHQGALKGGQKHKILADAVKLAAVRKVRPGARLLIVLADEAAAAGVRGGWRRFALEELGVEVLVVPLPDDVRARVVAAQERQKMVNAKGGA